MKKKIRKAVALTKRINNSFGTFNKERHCGPTMYSCLLSLYGECYAKLNPKEIKNFKKRIDHINKELLKFEMEIKKSLDRHCLSPSKRFK